MPVERIKHLEFIQAVITRQAANSFTIRGWSLTVSAAIYAYTAANLNCWLALVSLLPGVAFGWIDAYYLRQERLFRELYQDAIKPDTEVPMFSMDTSRYCNSSRCTYWSAIKSNPLMVMHGVIVTIGAVLFGVAIF